MRLNLTTYGDGSGTPDRLPVKDYTDELLTLVLAYNIK